MLYKSRESQKSPNVDGSPSKFSKVSTEDGKRLNPSVFKSGNYQIHEKFAIEPVQITNKKRGKSQQIPNGLSDCSKPTSMTRS